MQQKKFLFAALFSIFLIGNINAKDPFKNKSDQLRFEMIKLWEDHIVYTRNFIISTIANLEDQAAITQRLLRNQDDIGNAFKPYFGNDIGNRLRDLLREHILIAADVVASAIAGNTQQFNQDYEAWKRNARMIARFLSKINCHWSVHELKEMLYEHLALTTQEASSRLQMNWQSDIRAYDKNHIHMLMFADILTKGIMKKFPDRF